MSTYETFDNAYMSVLDDIYNHADFFNQPRGFQSREKIAYNFSISQPVQRGVYNQKRKCNIVFNFAEALWYLTGNNRLDYISYYNKKMPDYSMDGRVLTGTAYGSKMFNVKDQQLSQWQNVKDLLIKDPDSKRAVLQIFDGSELAIPNNLDVSCTLGLQFFIRNNHLDMIAYMRANDAFRGIVSDVFSFTFIQELMARELHVPVGNYYHSVGTMHVYEPDNVWVTHVLETPSEAQFKFPEMPLENNWEMIHELMMYEEKLRKNELTMDWQSILATHMAPYWQQILALFSIYQMIHYNKKIDRTLFGHLLPIYQYFVLNKWPNHVANLEVGGNE